MRRSTMLATATALLTACLAAPDDADDADDVAGVEDESRAERAFPGRRGDVRVGYFRRGGAVREIVYEQFVDEGVGVMEGDILVDLRDVHETREQAERSLRSAVVLADDRWPGGVVPYRIDADVPAAYVQSTIMPAIAHWHAVSAVRLVPRAGHDDYVSFEWNDSGCSSYIGRDGGEQEINLSAGCSKGNVIHEIGHAVGLFHEQSRLDRDSHVTILWDNIPWLEEHNYKKLDECDFLIFGCADGMDQLGYDFGSVMHYGSWNTFDEEDGPVLVMTKKDGSTFTAQRNGLSYTDAVSVRLMYGLYGLIRVKWDALGGQASFLGLPTSDERDTPDGGGRENKFAGGAITWKRGASAAYAMSSLVYNRWLAAGGAARLGYATSDRKPTLRAGGHYNSFELATIYYTPQTGAHELHGLIRSRWLALGGESSALGYPKSDELPLSAPFGAKSQFEGGWIYWSPATGAKVIEPAFHTTYVAAGAEKGYLGFPVDEITVYPGYLRQEFQGGHISWSPLWGGSAPVASKK